VVGSSLTYFKSFKVNFINIPTTVIIGLKKHPSIISSDMIGAFGIRWQNWKQDNQDEDDQP
jgi:hypothetical protein